MAATFTPTISLSLTEQIVSQNPVAYTSGGTITIDNKSILSVVDTHTTGSKIYYQDSPTDQIKVAYVTVAAVTVATSAKNLMLVPVSTYNPNTATYTTVNTYLNVKNITYIKPISTTGSFVLYNFGGNIVKYLVNDPATYLTPAALITAYDVLLGGSTGQFVKTTINGVDTYINTDGISKIDSIAGVTEWISGMAVIANSPADDNVDISAGTYLYDSVLTAYVGAANSTVLAAAVAAVAAGYATYAKIHFAGGAAVANVGVTKLKTDGLPVIPADVDNTVAVALVYLDGDTNVIDTANITDLRTSLGQTGVSAITYDEKTEAPTKVFAVQTPAALTTAIAAGIA